jgi:glutamate 5-kinase
MSLWDNLFSHLRVPVAQILLTRNDIADVYTLISVQACFSADTQYREPNMSMRKIHLDSCLIWE